MIARLSSCVVKRRTDAQRYTHAILVAFWLAARSRTQCSSWESRVASILDAIFARHVSVRVYGFGAVAVLPLLAGLARQLQRAALLGARRWGIHYLHILRATRTGNRRAPSQDGPSRRDVHRIRHPGAPVQGTDPHNHFAWGENAANFALIGSAWIIAASIPAVRKTNA
jgi:hypothetical protein